ncbi:MAG: hypothetical protein GY749_17550 [Desulfobacteraceae bacterium]|nr:hypothetical protein [Desulfobacteraceae bacterium]
MKKFLLLTVTILACTHVQGADQMLKKQDISVSVSVPDMGWKIKIQEIWQVEKELWVISVLNRSSDMAAQMMTNVSDSVTAETPSFPVRHYVLGKTWKWKNKEPYVFLNDRKEIEGKLKKGKRLK